jgi:hypothetical protein
MQGNKNNKRNASNDAKNYIVPNIDVKDIIDATFKHHINLLSFFTLQNIPGKKFNRSRIADTADDFKIIFDREISKWHSPAKNKTYFINDLLDEVNRLQDLYEDEANEKKQTGYKDSQLLETADLFKDWLIKQNLPASKFKRELPSPKLIDFAMFGKEEKLTVILPLLKTSYSDVRPLLAAYIVAALYKLNLIEKAIPNKSRLFIALGNEIGINGSRQAFGNTINKLSVADDYRDKKIEVVKRVIEHHLNTLPS